MDHEEAIQNLATERYLLSEMPPVEREAFEEHYFECVQCAEDLRTAAQFLEDAKELWASEGLKGTLKKEERPTAPRLVAPEPKRSGWNWGGWLQPQFALAAMAVLVVSTGASMMHSRSLQNELTDAAAPRVATTATLRPATRGDAPTLTSTSGAPVILQFDLDPAPTSDLLFLVKSANDRTVLQFSGDKRQVGERVTVTIPRFNLEPGHYTIVVQPLPSSGGTTGELARFPFDVKRP